MSWCGEIFLTNFHELGWCSDFSHKVRKGHEVFGGMERGKSYKGAKVLGLVDSRGVYTYTYTRGSGHGHVYDSDGELMN